MQHVFVMKFLAQVYDLSPLQADKKAALDLINKAIDHTPTFIELQTVKARILKNIGDIDGGEEAMTTAKRLDEGDRFLNFKAAKYMLRNRKLEQADNTMVRWSADHSTGELNSHDMQNSVYSYETALYHLQMDDHLEAY